MIYIIQVLCPNRHAIYAIAYDPEITPHDEAMTGLRSLIDKWIADKTINPWCGICESRIWTFEQRRSKFTTMNDALVEMKKLELENMLTRILIDASKAAKN